MKMPIRDAFRRLKEQNHEYLLAFGVGEFFEFRYSDADAIQEILPDVMYDEEVDYHRILVHKNGFFQFTARLISKGLKVAMVSRKKVGNKITFNVSSRSDQ